MAPANFASTLREAQRPAPTAPVATLRTALIGQDAHDIARRDRHADRGAVHYVIRNDLV